MQNVLKAWRFDPSRISTFLSDFPKKHSILFRKEKTTNVTTIITSPGGKHDKVFKKQLAYI